MGTISLGKKDARGSRYFLCSTVSTSQIGPAIRIDQKRGIRLLQRSMIEEHERIKNQRKSDSSLADIAPNLLETYENDLDIKLLQNYIADMNKRRKKSFVLAA